MALNLAAGIELRKWRLRAAASCFLLGQNEDGAWVIRETTGRKAGLFRSRKDAIRYARDESPGGDFTIVYRPGGLELLERHEIGKAA
jgi:hypothetical protein